LILIFGRSFLLFITIILSSEQVLSACRESSERFLILGANRPAANTELGMLRSDIIRILQVNNSNDPVMISGRTANLFVRRIERFERGELAPLLSLLRELQQLNWSPSIINRIDRVIHHVLLLRESKLNKAFQAILLEIQIREGDIPIPTNARDAQGLEKRIEDTRKMLARSRNANRVLRETPFYSDDLTAIGNRFTTYEELGDGLGHYHPVLLPIGFADDFLRDQSLGVWGQIKSRMLGGLRSYERNNLRLTSYIPDILDRDTSKYYGGAISQYRKEPGTVASGIVGRRIDNSGLAKRDQDLIHPFLDASKIGYAEYNETR
jgi:hypothetical protein